MQGSQVTRKVSVCLSNACIVTKGKKNPVLGKLLFKSNLSMSTITWLEK